MKRIICIAAIVTLLGGSWSSARADLFQLRLTDGTSTVTITDGGPGDSNPNTGVITWIGSIGVWNINVSTGVSGLHASPSAAHLDLNSIDLSTGTGNLTIMLSQTGFPAFPQNGVLAGHIGGTTTGTVDAHGYKNHSDGIFDTTNPDAFFDLGPFGGPAFAGSGAGPHGPLGMYSMTEVVHIHHDGAGETSFDFSMDNVVPAPAGIVMLLTGAPLAGAGYWLRRRRAIVA